jgi:hypothetical protein
MFDLRNCTSCTGQYDVELHGTAGLWMVPFRVHQRGLPFRNSPEAPQLAAVQTDMVGKVFFTAKPGHSANGSVAAAITHSDDYLTPGLQQYGQTAKIAPGAGEARFTQSTGRRVVSFTGSVTSVQSNGSGTIDQPLTVDQIAHIKITDDKRNVDGVAIAFARSASHGHLSHPYGKDRVRVTIGAPRRVGG